MMEGYAKLLLLLCLGLTNGFDNFDLRLAGRGSVPGQGRVEVYYKGAWGTVCDDLWGQTDADVVCRQLGYTGAVRGGHTMGAVVFGPGPEDMPIHFDEVSCTGHESSIAECKKDPAGEHNCIHREDAGVICTFEIRLAGTGSTSSQGRVEIYAGKWGTVCDDYWGQENADVACRMLGFPGASGFTTRAQQFGPGTGPILLDDVMCSGTETSLSECSTSSLGLQICRHSEDAGVICLPPVTPTTDEELAVIMNKKGSMKEQEEKTAALMMQLKENEEKRRTELNEKDVVEALTSLLSKLKQK